MSNRRVVITGLGVITPLGTDIESLWNKIISSESGIDFIKHFNIGDFAVKIAGEVLEEWINSLLECLTKKERELLGSNNCTSYLYFAVKAALIDAGFELDNLPNMGLIIGVGQQHGEYEKLYILLKDCIEPDNTINKEKLRIKIENDKTILNTFYDYAGGYAPISKVGSIFNFQNPVINISTACASGSNAVGEAYRKIKSGVTDRIVAGGVDSMINPSGIAMFTKLKTLSTANRSPEKVSCPFDAARDGFVLGEGAGVLVLEELGQALNNGKKIYGEVVGYGSNTDTYHVTSPDPSGIVAAEAMGLALQDAELGPEEVDYINAHGTGTIYNDLMETKAIKLVFKEYADRILVSSTKSHIGHLISAAGAVELVICALALKKQMAPPTINYENQDPLCDLNYVPNHAQPACINIVMSNSIGFGGQNAVIILKKYSSSLGGIK